MWEQAAIYSLIYWVPPQLAEILSKNATKIISNLELLRKSEEISLALDMELTDLELLATLQLFFAERLKATLVFADHLILKKELRRDEIDAHLERSINHWKKIIALKEKYNKETIPYMFNEKLNYNNYLEILEEEVRTYPGLKEFLSHDLK